MKGWKVQVAMDVNCDVRQPRGSISPLNALLNFINLRAENHHDNT